MPIQFSGSPSRQGAGIFDYLTKRKSPQRTPDSPLSKEQLATGRTTHDTRGRSRTATPAPEQLGPYGTGENRTIRGPLTDTLEKASVNLRPSTPTQASTIRPRTPGSTSPNRQLNRESREAEMASQGPSQGYEVLKTFMAQQ